MVFHVKVTRAVSPGATLTDFRSGCFSAEGNVSCTGTSICRQTVVAHLYPNRNGFTNHRGFGGISTHTHNPNVDNRRKQFHGERAR